MGVLDFLNTGMQVGAQVLNQANMREAWKREDTAVQRRVADLKAAGLSPVLAAGGAATTSGPIRVDAPVINRNVDAQNAGIGRTKAQIDLTEAQAEKTGAEAFISSSIKGELIRRGPVSDPNSLASRLIMSEINKRITNNEEEVRNVGIARKYGIPSNAPNGYDYIANSLLMKNLFPSMEEKKAAGVGVLLNTLKSIGK